MTPTTDVVPTTTLTTKAGKHNTGYNTFNGTTNSNVECFILLETKAASTTKLNGMNIAKSNEALNMSEI